MFTPGYKEYRGGVAAIQNALRQGDGSGFTFLNCRGKRQLSIESLVLREAWAHLFDDRDKRIAQERLDGIAKGAGTERNGRGLPGAPQRFWRDRRSGSLEPARRGIHEI